MVIVTNGHLELQEVVTMGWTNEDARSGALRWRLLAIVVLLGSSVISVGYGASTVEARCTGTGNLVWTTDNSSIYHEKPVSGTCDGNNTYSVKLQSYGTCVTSAYNVNGATQGQVACNTLSGTLAFNDSNSSSPVYFCYSGYCSITYTNWGF